MAPSKRSRRRTGPVSEAPAGLGAEACAAPGLGRGVHLSVGGDAEVAPGRNQAQLIPGAVCPERRSDTIATRWLVGGLTTSPPLATHLVPRASRPDRLPRRAGSGSLPRILVDQPLHAPPTDHLTVGNCREHSRPTRRLQLEAAMRSVPVVVLDVLVCRNAFGVSSIGALRHRPGVTLMG